MNYADTLYEIRYLSNRFFLNGVSFKHFEFSAY